MLFAQAACATTVVQVDVGGSVFCGGNNEWAQLGVGDTEFSPKPREVLWE